SSVHPATHVVIPPSALHTLPAGHWSSVMHATQRPAPLQNGVGAWHVIEQPARSTAAAMSGPTASATHIPESSQWVPARQAVRLERRCDITFLDEDLWGVVGAAAEADVLVGEAGAGDVEVELARRAILGRGVGAAAHLEVGDIVGDDRGLRPLGEVAAHIVH